MSPERITSRQNPLLQHVKKLQTSKGYREQRGEFVGDGVKLLEEAVRWCKGLSTVIVAEGTEICPLPEGVRVVMVPPDVLRSISQMQTPQGVLFTCKLPTPPPLHLQGACLVLDGIQDPGNLGTILRTADALDAKILLTRDCADPYNPKTVRASMGAIFRTPPQQAARGALAALCKENGVPLIATAFSEGARDIREVSLQQAAVIIGSEGRGVSPELLALADFHMIIPMSARCESLNAAVAATIVLWQMKK